ncbi:unnamed protein product [Protopolystoma xenopodis]|uniref:Uncharacterized protein n=1 Tax=Protopolystoma xenopodis TaxID=117903 RepID=A0A3S5CLW9_9PLAT|nr:unnamed protein product [Protopolystoma xenopodis]
MKLAPRLPSASANLSWLAQTRLYCALGLVILTAFGRVCCQGKNSTKNASIIQAVTAEVTAITDPAKGDKLIESHTCTFTPDQEVYFSGTYIDDCTLKLVYSKTNYSLIRKNLQFRILDGNSTANLPFNKNLMIPYSKTTNFTIECLLQATEYTCYLPVKRESTRMSCECCRGDEKEFSDRVVFRLNTVIGNRSLLKMEHFFLHTKTSSRNRLTLTPQSPRLRPIDTSFYKITFA